MLKKNSKDRVTHIRRICGGDHGKWQTVKDISDLLADIVAGEVIFVDIRVVKKDVDRLKLSA